MKDDPVYTPDDCYLTFPFPQEIDSCEDLANAGERYHQTRADAMITLDAGMTEFYGYFHDPENATASVVNVRELHDSMDRAVLDAYGWTDIKPKCEFIPEFDDEDENDDDKPTKYRYRWPDEVRDEVLARLLELNRKRGIAEGQIVTEEKAPKKRRARETETTLFE
jgi:hypothetical protein